MSTTVNTNRSLEVTNRFILLDCCVNLSFCQEIIQTQESMHRKSFCIVCVYFFYFSSKAHALWSFMTRYWDILLCYPAVILIHCVGYFVMFWWFSGQAGWAMVTCNGVCEQCFRTQLHDTDCYHALWRPYKGLYLFLLFNSLKSRNNKSYLPFFK